MNKVLLLFLFLFLGNVIDSARADRKSSIDLNSKGYNLYVQKKYYLALMEFRKAIIEDPSYVFPHYNLACTISLIKNKNDFSEFIKRNSGFELRHILSLINEAMENLEYTIKLDPQYRLKARKDNDLHGLRNEPRYYIILDYDLNNAEDIKEMLFGMEHWELQISPDAETLACVLRFYKDGTMLLYNLFWEIESNFTDEVKGTYEIKIKTDGNIVKLNLIKTKLGRSTFLAHLVKKEEKLLLFIDNLTEDNLYINKPFEPYRFGLGF